MFLKFRSRLGYESLCAGPWGRCAHDPCGRDSCGRVRGGLKLAGVVLIADDLGAWLVGLVADAGRKKLTALVLGSDQERALRKAADDAARATAAELNLSAEQPRRLAMVKRTPFRKPLKD